MALKMIALLMLRLFLHSFSVSVSVSEAREDDIRCLKAIKASLEDPFYYLNTSWNFNNRTEGFICRFTGVACWHPDENKVLNLHLSDMGLEGNFPRGIKYCTSLTGLDLSYNRLSGTIPSDLANLLPYMTSLDLSFNNFSGEIPKSLANCSYLNVLKLHHNRLTGNLPKELGQLGRIKKFSVANNLLSGPVPDFLTEVVDNTSYANNPRLCGGPLGLCRDRKPHSSFKSGFAFGYLLSAGAIFISFSLFWLQLEKRVKRMVFFLLQNRNIRKEDNPLILRFPTLKHQKEISQLEKMVNRMNFRELCKATDNFSEDNVIGRGNTGTMYKATLPNGWFLAVKRLNDSPEFESQFVSELLALSRMRHENLIPLLGFSIENDERFLVYKHMSNGNLHDCLHAEKGLRWPVRVKIAMGIARGLAWLHHKCIIRVVHRKISSSCVLLDRYFEPKISNFGCTMMSNHGGAMFVYPNENDSGLFVNSGVWESVFVKKDVYDYGLVLLELITGKETISSCSSSLHKSLVEWIDHLSSSSSIFSNDAMDKPLRGQGFDGEILKVLKIATDCVHPLPYERPTMLRVYERLSNLGARYGIPCDFGLLLLPRRTDHCSS